MAEIVNPQDRDKVYNNSRPTKIIKLKSPKFNTIYESVLIWRVLLGYRVSDFEHRKKPKGGPLEIEKFFVEGVNERGWRGVRSLLKPPSVFVINKK